MGDKLVWKYCLPLESLSNTFYCKSCAQPWQGGIDVAVRWILLGWKLHYSIHSLHSRTTPTVCALLTGNCHKECGVWWFVLFIPISTARWWIIWAINLVLICQLTESSCTFITHPENWWGMKVMIAQLVFFRFLHMTVWIRISSQKETGGTRKISVSSISTSVYETNLFGRIWSQFKAQQPKLLERYSAMNDSTAYF